MWIYATSISPFLSPPSPSKFYDPPTFDNLVNAVQLYMGLGLFRVENTYQESTLKIILPLYVWHYI